MPCRKSEVDHRTGHGGGGGNLPVALPRQSRADASTVGWRVRHGGEEGGQGRVGNYRGPEKRGL